MGRTEPEITEDFPEYNLGYVEVRPYGVQFESVKSMLEDLAKRDDSYFGTNVVRHGVGSAYAKFIWLRVDGKSLTVARKEVENLVGDKCVDLGFSPVNIYSIERGDMITKTLEDFFD